MHRKHRSTVIAAKLLILSGVAAIAGATNQAGGDTMLKTAKGAFDVKVAPIATTEHPGGTTLGRFSLDKTFHGDLEATGSGEMLTAGTAVPGSAGYVAISTAFLGWCLVVPSSWLTSGPILLARQCPPTPPECGSTALLLGGSRSRSTTLCPSQLHLSGTALPEPACRLPGPTVGGSQHGIEERLHRSRNFLKSLPG